MTPGCALHISVHEALSVCKHRTKYKEKAIVPGQPFQHSNASGSGPKQKLVWAQESLCRLVQNTHLSLASTPSLTLSMAPLKCCDGSDLVLPLHCDRHWATCTDMTVTLLSCCLEQPVPSEITFQFCQAQAVRCNISLFVFGWVYLPENLGKDRVGELNRWFNSPAFKSMKLIKCPAIDHLAPQYQLPAISCCAYASSMAWNSWHSRAAFWCFISWDTSKTVAFSQ